MESRPEQMQALMPGLANNKFPLQTLVQEVEEVEGRGRPEVVSFFTFSMRTVLCFFTSDMTYYTDTSDDIDDKLIWARYG